tara:strand:- start:529 stop:900 length:372 start_codon:yes stop_codon:yes gene_type:complete
MSNSQTETTDKAILSNEMKPEQALGLIGVGLMQKISEEGLTNWSNFKEGNSEKVDLSALRQRLELTDLAIKTGAPLSTSEVSQILGVKPGSEKIQRGGVIATKISRNVWKITRADSDQNYWRN